MHTDTRPLWLLRFISWLRNDYETGKLGHFSARRDRRTGTVSVFLPWYSQRLEIAADIAAEFIPARADKPRAR